MDQIPGGNHHFWGPYVTFPGVFYRVLTSRKTHLVVIFINFSFFFQISPSSTGFAINSVRSFFLRTVNRKDMDRWGLCMTNIGLMIDERMVCPQYPLSRFFLNSIWVVELDSWSNGKRLTSQALGECRVLSANMPEKSCSRKITAVDHLIVSSWCRMYDYSLFVHCIKLF